MHTHTTRRGLEASLAPERRAGRRIGFVPTMGALHDGHASLMRAARAGSDVVVASIFVNPLQFGPAEDFSRYPRDLAADARLAARCGVDHLFVPSLQEMYPAGAPGTRVDVGPIGQVGEGRWRPGFFSGVATVCLKLFHIVAPDQAWFGQKDAQQLAVIRQMVTDLDLPVGVVGCPTVREPDGLALSSRNAYLNGPSRRAAPALAQALFAAREAVDAGASSAEEVRQVVQDRLAAVPEVRLQYADLFDPDSFACRAEVATVAILAAAAEVGGTRLIDNVVLERSLAGVGSRGSSSGGRRPGASVSDAATGQRQPGEVPR
jgi:pantoate--beta-alanine ligase